MLKKLIFTIVGLLLVLGLLGGIKGLQIGTLIAAGKSMLPPPTSVTTAKVERQSWLPAYNAVGDVVSVQGVTVTTEAPGKVVGISFESGSSVKVGDLLVELDVSAEKAQLASAAAAAQLARVNLQRSRELRANQTISQSDLDTVEAQAKQAEAQIANVEAAIAKKIIRAPFAGRLGLRMVNLGQFVASGEAIVSLQSVDPVYVDFYLPQQRLADIKEGFGVEVFSDTDSQKLFTGKVTAISSAIDAATRNIKVRATLANPEGSLRSGMYVNTRVIQPTPRNVIVIPATAVLYAPYGDSVFVAQKSEKGDGLVVVQKFVRLGETRGDFVEVTKGLAEGEDVVSNGAFKLRNGAAVTLHNDLAPEVKLAPTPTDT